MFFDVSQEAPFLYETKCVGFGARLYASEVANSGRCGASKVPPRVGLEVGSDEAVINGISLVHRPELPPPASIGIEELVLILLFQSKPQDEITVTRPIRRCPESAPILS